MEEGASAARFIRTNKDEILRHWFDEASKVASARGLERPEFINIMPKFLGALAEADGDLGTFSGERRKYLESHLAARIRQGFSVEEVVAELGLVRTAAEQVISERAPSDAPAAPALIPLWLELERAAAAVTDIFTRHMAEDEQVEKHYLLRLRGLAAAGLREGGVPLRNRLDEVVTLLKEAIGVDSTTLLLYDAAAHELASAASAGVGADKDYVASLDIRSFVGQVAASEEPIYLRDVPTTRLEIPDALRRSGIRSLLGLRLPERETLTGVVYIGLREQRPFTGRETARLEVLGEQLTLHLDNAALIEKLRANIAALEDERALRERFVSVLAHDLRGPLSAAKMAAQLLVGDAHSVVTREPKVVDLARRIDRNLDRTDRMVRDLLDANRIHAGEELALEIADCDLVQIARDTIGELETVHGARFRLGGDPAVRGRWDAGQLGRALWNLGVNAVKYGSPSDPITVTVCAASDYAVLSVHNEGEPIAREEQDALFRPFMRSSMTRATSAKGWGLGLTLVRGAAEAHGGRVRVESDAMHGTTFTLDLPYDAARRS